MLEVVAQIFGYLWIVLFMVLLYMIYRQLFMLVKHVSVLIVIMKMRESEDKLI